LQLFHSADPAVAHQNAHLRLSPPSDLTLYFLLVRLYKGNGPFNKEARETAMPFTNRRTILRAAAALPVFAGGMSRTAAAETAPVEAQKPAAVPAAPPPHVTQILANYIVTAKYDELPANVRKEGVRTLLNWVGVAIGGSHHQTVDIAASALAPFSGPSQPRCSAAASALTS
jgi:hypothetical protein